ncbi:ArsA family ATPase [Lachnoclostridium phytofermentans]|uniref:arsenite-transporting ATPase n=1 Tax=Lachnoclostridium phytofermentans (strain ATCC 700394 / DSM 18823 / ISDg) TaxID=357809 RepID=A9KRJ6_LACP7|nr:ArsA family ATPase [Lachnoclostridium phytofermentans]ABX42070.1 Arsenite-transporting ATPase [Lachnoclostridium phytofermentans ISDg]
MRIILYTGKGGVGKTSISAATAVKLAQEGKKVLIMSTDQAHSLGDSLGFSLNGIPQTIAPNLDALEIDVVEENEKAWGNFKGFFKELLTSRAEGGIETEELLVFPGLEELFALFKILEIYENEQYDVLIVDCAPTGETLALLKFPELFGDVISKALPMKRKTAKIARPLVKTLTKIPMPKDEVFDDFERLMDKLGRLQVLMLNKDIVSLRIVTTPEKIVISETKRNYTCLHLYNYNVDAIIINKVYPKEALEGYFNKWVKLQKDGLNEIRESFREIPVFELQLQKQELKTIPILENLSSLYGTYNPIDVLAKEEIYTINKDGDIYIMAISLPFVDKSEMDLVQQNGEIQISFKNEKRCLTPPDYLKDKEISSAKMEQGKLIIYFE